jgi:hypothetical protein
MPMHFTSNYAHSPFPDFDAVQDIKNYFGPKYSRIALEICNVWDQDQFILCCEFAGIKGFPVKAWYEHFHGLGSWDPIRQSNRREQYNGHSK